MPVNSYGWSYPGVVGSRGTWPTSPAQVRSSPGQSQVGQGGWSSADGFDGAPAPPPVAGVNASLAYALPTDIDPAHPETWMTPSQLSAYRTLSQPEKAAFDDLIRTGADGSEATSDMTATAFLPTEARSNTHAVMQWAVANACKLLTSGGLDSYVAVSSSLQGDDTARRQLRDLALNGRLLDAGVSSGSAESVLAQLVPLAAGGGTARGIDRQVLLQQLVGELTRPDQAVQKPGTADCGGMAAGYLLSRQDPAQYVKAVTSLAEAGSFDFSASGGGAQRLHLDPSQPLDPNGSYPEQLFAHSFVESAGAVQTPSIDAARAGGIDAAQLATELGAVDGASYGALYLPPLGSSQRPSYEAEAEQVLQDELGAQKTVMANVLNDQGLYHWVTVIGIQGTGESAQVAYVDSSGAQATASLSDFTAKLNSVVFDASASHPAHLGQSGWGRPGGWGSTGIRTNTSGA